MSKKSEIPEGDGLPPNLPRLIYTRYTDEFAEPNFTMGMSGQYEVGSQLTALEGEARAKDSVILVQVSLVPYAKYYAPEPQQENENAQEQPAS